MAGSENLSNRRNEEDGVPVRQKEAAKVSAAKSAVVAPSQSRTVVGFGDGAAATLNAIRTGEGEKDSLDSRPKAFNMADLDVGGDEGSSSAISDKSKSRKRFHSEYDDFLLTSNGSRQVENLSCNDLQLEYVKPDIDNVNGSVIIPSDVVIGSVQYSWTLYGYFIEEKEIEFSLVNSHFRNMWKINGIEDTMVNDKGFYFFKFNSEQGMLYVLENGPWTINNTPIFLKRWSPGLILDKSKHDKLRLPVWIRIYDMPLELWNKKGMNIIASMLGNPLAIDSCTARMCMSGSGRVEYARVLVDFEATGNWPNEISVSVPNGNGYTLSTLRVEYSWKPANCSLCKVFESFDHTDGNCVHQKDMENDKDDQLNEIRLKKEQEEREEKRRYKAQPYLYTIIKVARDEDMFEQIGKDISFDLVDHDGVRSFCVLKKMAFNIFKEKVAKEFNVPVQFQRFWLWAKRANQTYRLHRPLTAQEETQPVGKLREVSNKNNNAELRLFLEIEIGPELQPLPPPEKRKDDILVFFKLYDPAKEQLRYVGSFFVKSSGKPTEIISKLNERAGFSQDEEIELYEEIKFEPGVMCERLDKTTSFRSSQIRDGDIICFQKVSQAQAGDKYRYPDVPSFLEYVKNRQIVHFRALDRPKEDLFCLELSKLHTYDDVAERVAGHIGLNDPSRLRLTSHDCNSQQPKPHPIKFQDAEHLLDMLVVNNQPKPDTQPVQGPVEVPQPMKGKEVAIKAENQAVDEPQACRFTWYFENFSCFTSKKLYSDVFVVDGFKWRVLIFPKGNNVNDLSVYLDAADSLSLPYGWSHYAEFSFSIVNQINNRSTITKDTHHTFHARESDWGFKTFMPLSEFNDPGKGFIVNDTCIIEAEFAVQKVVAEHPIDMPVHYNQVSDILYYEVLDILELQREKTLKVAFHHSTKEEPVIHYIGLPKQSTVGDVLNVLKTKVELSHPDAELRLLQVFNHNIFKIFSLTEKIENINDQFWTLRAEEIPEEEKNMGPKDQLIHVYHFTKKAAQNQMQVQNFGEPFFLMIHENETLSAVKVRIQNKLQVPDDEFSKWRFAFVSLGRLQYLQDSDVVSIPFQRKDLYGAWEQYLGLEHSDTTP